MKKEKIVYSNIPNALFEGELKAKEVLYVHQKIEMYNFYSEQDPNNEELTAKPSLII